MRDGSRFFVADASPIPLAVFRITFSAVLILDTLQTFYFRQLLFDPIPFVQPASIPFGPLLAIWLCAQLLLLVGFRTRLTALMSYLIAVFVLGYVAKDVAVDWHVDGIFLTCLLLLLLIPSDRVLSVDAWLQSRRPTPVPRIHSILLLLAIGILYLDSALWKLTSPMYLSGLGFWAPASLPFNSLGSVSWLIDSEVASRAVGYFVLVFEILFLAIVRLSRPRMPVLALGMIFHLGILVVLPIPWFSFLMLALYLGVVPGEVYERLVPVRTRITPTASADSAFTAPVRLDWASAAAGLIVLFWIPSALLIALRSPLLDRFVSSGTSSAVIGRMASSFAKAVYPWTGLTAHGVFMDHHFRGYSMQTRLVFRRGTSEVDLPLTEADGTIGWYDTNRIYVVWTFRAVKPGLPKGVVEHKLKRFVDFWAGRNGVDLVEGEVLIRQRPIEVSLERWQSELLDRNSRSAWRDAGRISGHPGQLRVDWTASGGTASAGEEPAATT